MRRSLLRLGDKSTAGGVVIEGEESCTHHGRSLTFTGAKVLCPVCNTTGVIGWKGPHRKSTMKGKQQALEGDLCLCNCDPPPVMIASQDTAWHEFTASELEGTAYGIANEPRSSPTQGVYDEQFTLKDSTGKSLPDTYYTAWLPSGARVHGITDSQGRTGRYATEGAQHVSIYLGHRE
ncbi:PAAR domain-containing protein [Paraburkholderia pallida]|uniref:PAAR domain-containing protein n=1 Tax=Paraburkholderia pallida TaxID=2547399 RepID=A0A4P7D559_9BURK|nr:PAAR domain-containing protein [Paraburkholderia pallida]QBR01714.1 PAAR domain-containing protein [Paraburkholderia pallida]